MARVASLLALMLCMALTWHQYPSGQSAVAIPVLLLGYEIIFRWRWINARRRLVGAVVAGAVLWYLGLPASYFVASGEWEWLNPFTLTTERALWGRGDEHGLWASASRVMAATAIHLTDFLAGLTTGLRYSFHQDFVPVVSGLPPRNYGWLSGAFALVGVLRCVRSGHDIRGRILLAWLCPSLAPAILSEHAYPKRGSMTFAALDVFAALGVLGALSATAAMARSIAVTAVVVGLVSYATVSMSLWFSGRQWAYGRPPDLDSVEIVRKQIQPGTIIIGDLRGGYYEGKFNYLFIDSLLNNQPVLFHTLQDHDREWPILINRPLAALESFLTGRRWHYHWTPLRSTVA